MTTYNTYQEAKIASPESDIFTNTDNDKFKSKNDDRFFIRCIPKQHCMTVEKFLADGYKFAEGDLYLDNDADLKEIANHDELMTNEVMLNDDKRYILRAAALEEKKPRTKVAYVECNFSREWEAVRYYNEEGELFVIDCNGNYSNVNDISGAWYEVVCKNLKSLYRAVHVEIDWRDDAISHFNTTPSLHEDDRLIDLISKKATKQESDAFIKLCHLVSSLNSVN